MSLLLPDPQPTPSSTPVPTGAHRTGSPWPRSARTVGGDVRVAGVALADVAATFGTPVHVLDETEVRARARTYREHFGADGVFYAAKAFTCRALVRWLADEGLGMDVCSAGELRTALDGGLPAHRTLLHGVAKSPADLRAAMEAGVGRIVLDSPDDADLVASLLPAGARQQVLLRLVPGISAGAHPKVRTATPDQQFGTATADVDGFVDRVLAHRSLELVGLHCHLGSQITEIAPYQEAALVMAGVLARVRNRHGLVLRELDLGGGHGIAHRPGEPGLDVADLARCLRRELRDACDAHGLRVPHLSVEPGRAVVGPAGVVVYRVAVLKRTPHRTFVVVDGGMSDNPRPALYGAQYAPRLVGRVAAGAQQTVTVVGRHCETGDVLAADVPLPVDVRPGDLIAFPAAGAYHVSMASNYNAVPRPPVVAVRGGEARLLVRRETVEDLGRRDVGR
ncbi:diaminopimelate decarboxylase [Kineococcus rhizosphaerae]|uniref:Diaminopimelate decarboxylase n=1 Tax=Kineococcus rhizosphaerae TaxID=559628 RepID=A0A2T0R2A2_9ACTN|nr:diaminopimelate decarboxylase [Kineococcus rhizosphaerae]PRY13937.1 diaminopimelate decarboxylase [Kineococcus rhizosphaerae]